LGIGPALKDNENSRIKNNQDLLSGEWTQMEIVDLEIQLGSNNNCLSHAYDPTDKWSDSCWAPSQRQYNLMPNQRNNGSVTYKAINPLADTETLDMGPDGKGSLSFTSASAVQPGQFTLNCQSHFQPIAMP
jgi:hypothetical protein